MKWIPFFAGVALSLLLLLSIVSGFGLQPELFRRALVNNTDLPAALAEDFSQDTMAYLSGEQDGWNAAAILSPVGIVPSEAFSLHMAEVRDMVHSACIALWVLLCVSVLLLVVCFLRKMSIGALGAGLFTPLLICLLIGVWCLLDFEGFWYLLHRVFIPGGIFSANELIMRLFPAGLFSSYAILIFPVYLVSVLLASFLLISLHRSVQKRKKTKTVHKKEGSR